MKLGQQATTQAQWAAFTKRYRAEMTAPDCAHALGLLAALSKQTHFSVGCYCENEDRCHRSILKLLLAGRGAVSGWLAARTRVRLKHLARWQHMWQQLGVAAPETDLLDVLQALCRAAPQVPHHAASG